MQELAGDGSHLLRSQSLADIYVMQEEENGFPSSVLGELKGGRERQVWGLVLFCFFFFFFHSEKELGAIAANRLGIEHFCICNCVSSVFPFPQ